MKEEKESIKMTNREAEMLMAHPGIKKFLQRESGDIPTKVLYWVARIKTKLLQELKIYFDQCEKERAKCASQKDGQAERDPRGNYVPDTTKISDLVKSLESIGKEQIELFGVYWLEIDFENGIDGWGITGEEIEGLLLLTKRE